MSSIRLYLTITFALVAFAGNSILCRIALLPSAVTNGHEGTVSHYLIDPNSFTALRLLSGAVTLFLLVLLTTKSSVQGTEQEKYKSGSWLSSIFLFTYAITFSFAYVSLDTGVGALILFGAVQLTMILYSLTNGHKPKLIEWLGLILAFSGLVYLVAPTLSTPSAIGFILMVIAGIAWGGYTIAGKNVSSPLLATSSNFVKTVPLVVLSVVIYLGVFNQELNYSYQGVVLALLSGCLASGVGYALWYAAVKQIQTTQAAVLQLLVPIIAAIGGVVFADENITSHLIISSSLILGGVLFVLLTPKQAGKTHT